MQHGPIKNQQSQIQFCGRELRVNYHIYYLILVWVILQTQQLTRMLARTLFSIRLSARKVKQQPMAKPEGAQKVKFTEQELSSLGAAAKATRVPISKAFKQKYTKTFQQFEQQTYRKQMDEIERKSASDKQKELYNKAMPHHAKKEERLQPHEMTLEELSSVRLGPQYLPVGYLKQAQKIFHKYGQTKLRQISSNFSKLMSVRYTEEKLDFQSYQNLKFQRLEMRIPKQKQIQQIYLIGEQKIYKQEQHPTEEEKTRKVDDSDTFTPEISYTQNIAISYLLNRAPRTFATAIRMMTEIKYKYPDFKPKSFLDFGGGLSAGACAFIDIFDETGEVYSVQPAAKMRKLSKFLTQDMKIKYYQSLGQMSSQIRQVDIVYAGYVINELKPDLVQVYLQALYTKVKNQGFLVVVEYGSPFGSRLINEVRKWAIQKKMFIAAPCPHQLKCPLAKSKSWCHFDQPSGIYPQNVFGKLPTEQAVRYEKFSYLILQKKQEDAQLSELQKNEPNITKQWDRVIFPIIRRGSHTLFNLCTKSGTFQRRVSAKSHGIQYKEGKKLKWGDYWRFGKRIPNKYRKQRKTGRRLW